MVDRDTDAWLLLNVEARLRTNGLLNLRRIRNEWFYRAAARMNLPSAGGSAIALPHATTAYSAQPVQNLTPD